jgi:hypothetical protein
MLGLVLFVAAIVLDAALLFTMVFFVRRPCRPPP